MSIDICPASSLEMPRWNWQDVNEHVLQDLLTKTDSPMIERATILKGGKLTLAIITLMNILMARDSTDDTLLS